MYFLSALAVAVISLFVPMLITALINRDYFGKLFVGGLIGTACYTLVLWLVYWLSQVGFYGPLPFGGGIFLGIIISMVITGIFTKEFFTTAPSWVMFALAIIYLIFVVLVGQQSSMFNAKGQAELIGKVETIQKLEEAIEPADNSHICLVSKEIATTNAQNALSKVVLSDGAVPGSRYTIGEPTKQFVDGSYWWIFPLEFGDYFKWNQDRQVPAYLRVSAEDPGQQPQAIQSDSDGNEIHIKYLNSAHFENRAKRYLRQNGYFSDILLDWTFEVNDSWRPYYTVSVAERKFGFAGYVVKGIILFDIQTGETIYYKVNDVPSWVDRTIPLDEVIDYNVKKWGLYANDTWWGATIRKTKSQKPTEGWFLTYNGDHCQWFTGFTSINESDSALTGFMLVDSKTGAASFYRTSGVTEDLAYDSARTLWNNFPGYAPTELVPYNIYGHLTYVIPMQCENQFSGVSLVALDNINIKAKGDTLEEALRAYRKSITTASTTGLAPQSGEIKSVELTGVVEYVGLMTDVENPIISFKLKDIGKVFQVVYSDVNPKIIFISVGQTVTLVYMETTEVVVSVDEFDIPSIVLEDGSVTQARYVDNQAKVDEETERINDEDKLDDLLNSDEMQNVDPAALEEFLKQQAAQQGDGN